MIAVSNAWKDVQQRFLLPESFIEIDCGITDDEAQAVAEVSGADEAVFSHVQGILDELTDTTKFATLEHNLWSLDGSLMVLPSEAPQESAEYVSNIESTGSVTLTFPAVRTTAISGVTITWSERYDEYAKTFSVIGKNGDATVGEVTVTDNRERSGLVYLPLENYDSITVQVHEWSLPHRRVRIENIAIGHILKFHKSDLLSFSHEQDGDLISGKLPKYSIEFTLDNSDGRWDPNNPTGMARYLSERQRIIVKYGLDVNGTVEWIKAGTFYLSEWHAPPNGIEARFVARDMFEFMMGVEMRTHGTKSISGHINSAVPEGFSVVYDASLPDYDYEYAPDISNDTAAEMVQKCANAVGAIMRCDRDGVLHIETLKKDIVDYIQVSETATGIPLSLSYVYPEISLSKPLKAVSVDYVGEAPFVLTVSENGEQQTLLNEYIANQTNAERVASWVSGVLKNRKTISGEYRADPRLDLYDIVRVEDRYNRLLTVAITNIRYTFGGAFRGTYTGRIIEEV